MPLVLRFPPAKATRAAAARLALRGFVGPAIGKAVEIEIEAMRRQLRPAPNWKLLSERLLPTL